MTPSERSKFVKQIAMGRGFHLCGIAEAGPIAHLDEFRAWLAGGMAGSMGYMHRHQASREDLRTWIPTARSVIVVGLGYGQNPPEPLLSGVEGTQEAARGRIAMYAWGEDYHIVVRERLEEMVDDLREGLLKTFEARCCVDTSAIIERELAAAAGLGWIGKNGMVIHPELGSFFVLGEIITDLELAPDTPVPDRCGSCRRCLEACPTGTLIAPHLMDARRCISYLTIEHRDEIPPELAHKMGDWLFGCDVCQAVCPYNRAPAKACEPRFLAPDEDAARPHLDRILGWDDSEREAFVHGKATDRAKLGMWRRNAEIVRRNLEGDDDDAARGDP